MNGAVAFAILAAAAAGPATDRRPPVDQCADNASLAEFRDGLRAAVERKDREALLATVTEATIVNYGGGVGRADFIAAWGLDDPATSPVWRELGTALSLGCARDLDGSYWSPSLSVQLADQEDVFTAAVALPGAVLRAAPDAASAALATLEWDVLTLESDDGSDEWWPVSLADGRRGYVHRDQLRLQVDYRAVFERIDGRWVLAAFVAGD